MCVFHEGVFLPRFSQIGLDTNKWCGSLRSNPVACCRISRIFLRKIYDPVGCRIWHKVVYSRITENRIWYKVPCANFMIHQRDRLPDLAKAFIAELIQDVAAYHIQHKFFTRFTILRCGCLPHLGQTTELKEMRFPTNWSGMRQSRNNHIVLSFQSDRIQY